MIEQPHLKERELKMKGSVISMSPDRGKYVIENEQGEFTVFELINSTSGIEIGDEIVGSLDLMGKQKLENITKSGILNVSIIDIRPTQKRAEKLLK